MFKKITQVLSVLVLLMLCNTQYSNFLNLHANSKFNVHLIYSEWGELSAIAKETKIPMFVKISADWCPPCLEMEKSVFKDLTVINLLNDNFLSLDLESQSFDGYNFRAQYGIEALPDLIFFTPNAKPVVIQEGQLNIEETINIIKHALSLIHQNKPLHPEDIRKKSRQKSKPVPKKLEDKTPKAKKYNTQKELNNFGPTQYEDFRQQENIQPQPSAPNPSVTQYPDNAQPYPNNAIGKGDDNVKIGNFNPSATYKEETIGRQEKMEEFLQPTDANIATTHTSQFLGDMQRDFKRGNRDNQFLYEYSYAIKNEGLLDVKPINSYLKKNRRNIQINNRVANFVYDFSGDLATNAMELLIENQSWFESKYGKNSIQEKIQTELIEAAKYAGIKKDTKRLQKIINLAKHLSCYNQQSLIDNIRAVYEEKEYMYD